MSVSEGFSVMGEAQRTTSRRARKEEYEVDVPIDSEWYELSCIDDLIPTTKVKMPWLEGKDVFLYRTTVSLLE